MKISEAMADYFHYITAVDQKSMKTVESYKNECAHYLKALNEQGIEDMEDAGIRVYFQATPNDKQIDLKNLK